MNGKAIQIWIGSTCLFVGLGGLAYGGLRMIVDRRIDGMLSHVGTISAFPWVSVPLGAIGVLIGMILLRGTESGDVHSDSV